ncbi:MAG TPA: HEAT repeat domain-containing protein [Myxococcales bacterium]|jgi:HEAT repeat protein
MGLFSWLSGKKASAEETRSEPPLPHHETPLALDGLDDLIQGLDSRDGAVRVDAAQLLVERWRGGDGRAADAIAPRLEELLSDDEPQVRGAALSAVRMMRKPENLERLSSAVLGLFADPAPAVRLGAIWAAVRLPGDVARGQVLAALDSEDESTRFAAACALADVRDSAALEELIAAMHEDHRRQEALSALMSLGDAAALPALSALFDQESLGEFDRTLAAAALARFGDARGKAHLAERVAADGDDRPIATEWAGRLFVQEALPALEELSQTEGDPGRGAALRALGRLNAPGAEARLAAVAENEDEADDLRMDAVEGLAEVGALARLEALAARDDELGALCRELLVEARAEHSDDARAEQSDGARAEQSDDARAEHSDAAESVPPDRAKD